MVSLRISDLQGGMEQWPSLITILDQGPGIHRQPTRVSPLVGESELAGCLKV